MNSRKPTPLFSILATVSLITTLFSPGCSHNPPDREKNALKAEQQKQVNRALALFDPKNPQYNPNKAKFYLERVLRKGQLTSLDLPAPVILALLRSEKDAQNKRKAIERRISSIKRIDLDKDEEVR